MEAPVLRSVRLWIGLAVSLLFVVLLFRSAHPDKILDALRGANYAWLIPASLLYLVSLSVRSLRYRYLVRDLADVPATRLYPIICIAFMANNLLPARAGELVRAYVMGEKYGISKVSALGTVLVERLFDGLTLLLFLLITVATLGANSTLKGLAVISLAVFACGLFVFGAILRWPRRCETLMHRLTDVLPLRLRPLFRELSSSLLSGMVALRNPRALSVVVICSPLAWFMEGCCFWLVGRGFGLHLNIGWFLMAMAAGNLALTAPSSQGGIGPFEYFAEQVVILAGANKGTAAAYALVAHAVVIVPVVVLGLLFLSAFNISLGGTLKRGSKEDPLGIEPPCSPEEANLY